MKDKKSLTFLIILAIQIIITCLAAIIATTGLRIVAILAIGIVTILLIILLQREAFWAAEVEKAKKNKHNN